MNLISMNMDFRGVLDAASEIYSGIRKEYHVSLGELIKHLQDVNPDSIVREKCISDGWLSPDIDWRGYLYDFVSYRGYYEDLALCRSSSTYEQTAGDLLKKAKSALGDVFEGYKGGSYLMEETTPLWIVNGYSECGSAVIGIEINVEERCFILITKKVG